MEYVANLNDYLNDLIMHVNELATVSNIDLTDAENKIFEFKMAKFEFLDLPSIKDKLDKAEKIDDLNQFLKNDSKAYFITLQENLPKFFGPIMEKIRAIKITPIP
jgi:hypothetical protein